MAKAPRPITTTRKERDGALNDKQRRFVEEYLLDLNATRAAEAAGYSHPGVQGPRLLSNVRIAAFVQKAMNARSERTEVKADGVLLEIAKIAFADVRKAVRWRSVFVDAKTGEPVDDPSAWPGRDLRHVGQVVELVDSADLDDATAGAISEVRQTKEGLAVKFHSKNDALDKLARHLGLYAKSEEPVLNIQVAIRQMLMALPAE